MTTGDKLYVLAFAKWSFHWFLCLLVEIVCLYIPSDTRLTFSAFPTGRLIYQHDRGRKIYFHQSYLPFLIACFAAFDCLACFYPPQAFSAFPLWPGDISIGGRSRPSWAGRSRAARSSYLDVPPFKSCCSISAPSLDKSWNRISLSLIAPKSDTR